MLRAIILSLALAFAVPSLAHAQISSADRQAIDAGVATFFAGWNARKTKEACDEFMLPIVSEQPANIRNLVAITDQVVAYFDKPFQYEQVSESTLGTQLVYRKYILFNDKAPYVVTIVCFRTSAGWKAQNILLRDLTPDDVAG